MGWVKILATVFSLIPDIIMAIRAIEEAIPDTGKGVEKLAIVKGTLDAVADTAEEALEIWPCLEKVIGTIVGIFNKTGVFKK